MSVYLSYYIIALLIIRFYMWNRSIDLNILINKLKELHSINGILSIFFLISIWIFVLVCFIILRKILIKEIIRYHLYLFSHYGNTSIYRNLLRNRYFRVWLIG
jgi:hypothetical protein